MITQSRTLAFSMLVALALGGCRSKPEKIVLDDGPPTAVSAPIPAIPAAPSATAPAGPQWTKLTSAAGRFEALMLPDYKEESNTAPTAAGNIQTTSYMVVLESGRGYYVAFADYPAAMVTASNREKILDGARDGAAGNIKGKLVSEKKVSMDGSAGREIVIAASEEPVTVRVRMTLVKNRLYLIQALSVGPLRDVPDPDADRFLESLHFLQDSAATQAPGSTPKKPAPGKPTPGKPTPGKPMKAGSEDVF
jgi:hypothetical protein